MTKRKVLTIPMYLFLAIRQMHTQLYLFSPSGRIASRGIGRSSEPKREPNGGWNKVKKRGEVGN